MSTTDSSVLRALTLLRHLSLTKGITTRKIFDEIPTYNSDPQMLERDIQTFEALGFKLEKNFVGTKEKPQMSYQIDLVHRPGLLELPGQQNEELLRLALLLARNPIGPPLPLQDTLRVLMSHDIQASLGGGTSRIKDYNEMLQQILDAISINKQVQINDTVRLDPLYLAFLDMGLVLICWDHTHQEYQEKRLGDIKNVFILDEDREDHHPTNIRFLVEIEYLIFTKKQHWYTFISGSQENTDWVSIQAAGYIKARILWQMNELGPHVELLEPVELREEIIASLRRRFQMYLPSDE